jgi:SAM-dependent methyltransferase
MNLQHRFAGENRARKFALFMERLRPGPETTILDAGFTEAEHNPNDNFLERAYPWPAQITALGIEPAVEFHTRYPAVQTVLYDGRQMPFADKAFDIAWSNAVIEHVGDRTAQRQFLSELLRVSRTVFVTTPNRWFPFDLHTRYPLLHWLPKPACDALLRRLGQSVWTDDALWLLSARQFAALAKEGGAAHVELIRNPFLGFTVDFVLIAHA